MDGESALLAAVKRLSEKADELRVVENMSSAIDAGASAYEETLKAARRTVTLDIIQSIVDDLDLSIPSIRPLFVRFRFTGWRYGYYFEKCIVGPSTLSECIFDWKVGFYIVSSKLFLWEMEGLKRDVAEGRLDDQTQHYTPALIYKRLLGYVEKTLRDAENSTKEQVRPTKARALTIRRLRLSH